MRGYVVDALLHEKTVESRSFFQVADRIGEIEKVEEERLIAFRLYRSDE